MPPENGQITHKLVIKIPGEEKNHTTYHPNESAARAHLRARIKPQALGMPSPLPPGSEWILTAMVEEIVTQGEIPYPRANP